MNLYGKVTRCFPDKGYAFILGEDKNSYFLHYSNLNGEHIEKGYQIFFVPFQNERSDYNATKITVINVPEKCVKKGITITKKKNHKKHRVCNADKIIREDRKFQKFVKDFINEQKVSGRERSNNGNAY